MILAILETLATVLLIFGLLVIGTILLVSRRKR
jgi:LPXTG-motif cell wall-anchored protein